MSELAGQRALVTGASTGIGYTIAGELLRAGATVGLHHRRPTGELTETLEQLNRIGSGAIIPLQADLSEPDGQDRLVERFVETAGGIEILINNAGGLYGYQDFRTMQRDDWERTFALNVTAPAILSRCAWPHMEDAGRGRIINISTAAVGYGGSAKSLHYTASKAALEAVTRTLAKEGAASNILVNAIRCGVIDTKMHTRVDGYDEAQWRERLKLIPVGHPGQPADVAAMALYLLGKAGDFITGQVIAVSGGE
jgi:NAD(P)-dependent dehydrogenase (short-subunit alcohol dehydrogenase family)